jgi:hypothetical protein
LIVKILTVKRNRRWQKVLFSGFYFKIAGRFPFQPKTNKKPTPEPVRPERRPE